MDGSALVERRRTTFAAKGVREVQHLQAALRECIDALTPEPGDLLVLSTEYSNWEDSQRRIDLLAVDRSGALVVVELKRTEDAGHAELQALRYAAMVSQMTFDEGVQALALERRKRGNVEGAISAADDLAAFLSSDGDDGGDPRANFAHTVRIILAAADFSREVTHTVLWLLDQSDIDIRCVRLTPYDIDGQLHIYTEQVIPLPEAEDYHVRKAQRERAAQARNTNRQQLTRGAYMIWRGEELMTPAPVSRRRAFAIVVRALLDTGQTPEMLANSLGNPRLWYRAEGEVSGETLREEIRRLHPTDPQKASRYDLGAADLVRVNGATYALYNQNSAAQLPGLQSLATGLGIRWEDVTKFDDMSLKAAD